MKIKFLAISIYGATSIALASFLDGIYSGEPLTRHLMFLYALVGGLALFIVSTISSLFGKKLAILCGLMAAILSWPEFSLVLSTVPWRDLAWFLRYRMEATASLLCLFVSSIYSLSRLPSVVKSSQRYAAD